MIRVLVVHQTRLIANLVASSLAEQPDIFVVSTAISVEEALAKLAGEQSNMVLVAATLPQDGALTMTRKAAQAYPETKVLVIGVPKAEHTILQYVMAGASGYVLQDVSVERLLDHVRAAYDDKALISPDIAAAMMIRLAELSRMSSQQMLDQDAITSLTPREQEVLALIGEEGLSNAQIADRLVIEIGTVKNHVHNILKKLDVSSREEAAAYLPLLEDNPY